MARRGIYGLPGYTNRFWDPYPQRASGSARWDTLPIPDKERDEVERDERERRERGFGFAPVREPERQPLLWEGDGA